LEDNIKKELTDTRCKDVDGFNWLRVGSNRGLL